MTAPRVRHVVGAMTGTSLDGLDCALVRIEGQGLDMTAKFLGLHSRPFDDALREQLLHLAEGNAAPPIEFMRAARTLGVIHAQALEQLLETHRDRLPPSRLVPGAGPAKAATPAHTTRAAPAPPRGRAGSDPQAVSARYPGVDFVVAHGQTIWHAPQDTLSWQLFDPWPIVRHLGLPVCYDLRQADLIAGGQGAPITPIADWIIYREDANAVLNLGGIANLTRLQGSPADIDALDLCPCNAILDFVVQWLFPEQRYDDQGRIAAQGKVVDVLKQAIVIDVVAAIGDAKSLGRELFPKDVLDRWLVTADKHERREDVVASYNMAISELLAIAVRDETGVVVLAGGGARNGTLVRNLQSMLSSDIRLSLSDGLGIPCEAREAMAFAVLGALSQDGVPITLPQVTGARNPGIAGCWVYP